ncbi:STAS domain-containing protein [Streptomyces sp. NPDC058662]|uniref:STAS domain-containing protein n=1 Tax=Streptomyces sp. NPDC058662 TaxID=3346583 RepID=UPI003649D184
MTHAPCPPPRLTRADAGDTVRIELRGDLDRHAADVLLAAVADVLTEPAPPREPRERCAPRDLHLDCGGLVSVDSSGLSALLMVRRLTDAAGVRLHLEERPVQLDRMLRVTGTLSHLTAAAAGTGERSGSFGAQRRSAAPQESIPARSGGPDTPV